ncbi:hypothetical protein MCETHM1_01912 [Flavobacteriaceae bacterium]
MKKKILFLFIILYSLSIESQNFELKIFGNSIRETKIIDSIGYSSKHINLHQSEEEIKTIRIKLTNIGYLHNIITYKKKENDSVFKVQIKLEKKIKNIHIYIGATKNKILAQLEDLKQDSIELTYSQIEPFLKHITQKLEKNGYAFAKVKLGNIIEKNQKLYADLLINTGYKRTLNAIILNYKNPSQINIFPKGAEKQVNKKYKNSVFNQETVENIKNDFEKYRFINQTKYPEILFTKDTTKVFIYIEKKKANSFDGYIGFNNTEREKIKLNGYLDLTLTNALKNGEELSIYWKNDGENQKTFNAKLDIPYLLKSPIGIKGQINILKQDSIFQNTKTALQLGYFLNYNKRFYFGFESTESSDIQNGNETNLKDYKNTFFTSSFEIVNSETKNTLFPIKNYLTLTFGTGKRTNVTDSSIKQNYVNFNIMNNFYINENNIIYVKFQNYYLKSKTYLINELFRFGGINSIRGFAENSLQSNLLIALMSEYKLLTSQKLYFNSILDYCYYEDPTNTLKENKNKRLLGIGVGLGVETTSGLLKFSITNGKTNKQELKFYNTNITISYNVKF